MDIAKDSNGKNILADSPEAIRERRYSCINCGRQVTLRAKGSFQVRPYFAHLPGVANTEVCELYVQSNYENWFPRTPPFYTPPIAPKSPTSVNSGAFSTNQNIYIHNKKGVWGLSLVLKLNQWQRSDSGYILIRTMRGDVRIDHNEISFMGGDKLSIKIDFNFSAESITRNGSIDESLWAQLTENPRTLSPLNEVYMALEASGRKLGLNERLRKNLDYLYVSSKEIIGSIFLETVFRVDQVDQVWIYNFRIPLEFDSTKTEEIEEFLGRSVVDQPPKFSLEGLYPVSVDVDGTYIVLKSTKYFYLKTDGYLEVKSSKRYIDRTPIEGGTKYDVSLVDDFMILWENYPLIRFEKGRAKDKRVNGIKIVYGKNQIDLLDTCDQAIRGGEVVEFFDELFDSAEVKITVDGAKKNLTRGGRLDCSYASLIIDAGCYGYIDTYQEGNNYSEIEPQLLKSSDVNLLKFMGFNPTKENRESIYPERYFVKQRKYHFRMLEKVGDRSDFKKN